MAPRHVLLAVGGLLFAAGGGFLFAQATAPAPRVIVAQAAPVVSVPRPTSPPVYLERHAIRDEVHAALRETAAAPSAPADAPPEPSFEQLDADGDASQLVAAAERLGHWRAEDASALRRLMPRMSDTGREAAMGALVIAINSQRVTPDVVPPF